MKISSPDIKSKAKRECLLCLVVCHMLGYDVTFAYIHAVKLAQQGNALEKRAGYLLCALFLEESSDLAMLLVNTLLKDLGSSRTVAVCTALTCVPHLVRAEMVPALLPPVTQRLQHPQDIVRKKSVLCLVRLLQLAPDLVEGQLQLVEKALCDSSPSVVWAALCYYLPAAQANAAAHRHMAGVFVGILQQVIDGRLPAQYSYQRVPAPWLAVHLLKLLAALGRGDHGVSCQMYPVLSEILQRTEATTKTGLAVIYECLLTISTVFPDPDLLDRAAQCVSRFLSASSITLKYLGVKALSELVRVSPRFAMQHQAVVMECLEHSDPTLQNQAYDLLYGMANPRNLSVISGKLLERAVQTEDRYLRTSLVTKLLELCARFDTQFDWYMRTMNEILLQASELVPQAAVNTLLEAVFSVTSARTRDNAVRTYWMVLHGGHFCEPLLQVAMLTVCEYWQLLPDVTANEITDNILSWLPKCTGSLAQRSAVLGLKKVLPYTSEEQRETYLTAIREVIQRSNIKDRQIFRELEGVCQNRELSRKSAEFSKDSSKEIEFDLTLSFMDEYVVKALESGGRPYKPPHMRTKSTIPAQGVKSETGSLRFEAYTTSQTSSRSVTSPEPSMVQSGAAFLQEDARHAVELKVKRGVWGRGGYHEDAASTDRPRPHSENQQREVEKPPELLKAEKERQEFASALFAGISDSDTDTKPPPPLSLNLQEDDFSPKHRSQPSGSGSYQESLNNTDAFSQPYTASLDIGGGYQVLESQHMSELNHLKEDLIGNHGSPDSNARLDLTSPQRNPLMAQSEALSHPRTIASQANKQTMSMFDEFHRHRYANLLDENFDSDSLDGSPDKEAPPNLFRINPSREDSS